MGKLIAKVGKNCVACGTCLKFCPKGIISIYKGMYAKIETEKCAGCGRCEKNCPAGVIELVKNEKYNG